MTTDAGKGPQAVILAAGRGTRMAAPGVDPAQAPPKVLYEVADRPIVWWVVQACRAAGVERSIIVIGHRGDLVRAALADVPDVAFVEQSQQLGTGHAARMAQPLFDAQPACDLFVLAGDAPLIRPATLAALLETHRRTAAAATLATAVLDDPTGYGRILRDARGRLAAIVEEKDCTPDQRAVREINPSYYCFASDVLFASLAQVGNRNAQKEYYLTDVPGLLARQERTVSLVEAVPPQDVLGINTPADLARVDAILRRRLAAVNA